MFKREKLYLEHLKIVIIGYVKLREDFRYDY